MRSFHVLPIAILLCLPLAATADTGTSTRVNDPKQHDCIDKGGYPYRLKADYVLKELDLKPGDSVVDIGAGDGWWSERMARCVGEKGAIHAAEVEQKLVDKMKEKYAATPQIKPYLCKTDSLELPAKSVDLAFISQVYHHLSDKDRVDYLKRLREAVKPNGRLCVVEKYSAIATRGADHGTQLSRVVGEAEKAGWVPVRCELITGTEHYLAIFVQKDVFPAATPEAKDKPKEAPKTQN